jgi:hypothetical protein
MSETERIETSQFAEILDHLRREMEAVRSLESTQIQRLEGNLRVSRMRAALAAEIARKIQVSESEGPLIKDLIRDLMRFQEASEAKTVRIEAGTVLSASAALTGYALPIAVPIEPDAGARRHPRQVSFPPQIIQVWGYAIALSVILGGIGFLLSGSSELLKPVLAVCFAGGLVGTMLAVIRSLQEDRTGIFR